MAETPGASAKRFTGPLDSECLPTIEEAFGLGQQFTNLDGIEVMPDGSFIVSDYMGQKIAAVSADRRQVKTLYDLTTPADLGIDHERKRLYVPQLESDTVVVLSL